MSEPTCIAANTTVEWKRTFNDYPAPTWTLTYRFTNSVNAFEITATQDGTTSGFAVLVPFATTANYTPGEYEWVAYVTDGTSRYRVAAGRMEVLADRDGQNKAETRSDARIALEAVTATIYGRASRDQLAMSIQGRSIQRMPIESLMKLQRALSAQVAAEERREQGLSAVQVRNLGFRRPT